MRGFASVVVASACVVSLDGSAACAALRSYSILARVLSALCITALIEIVLGALFVFIVVWV